VHFFTIIHIINPLTNALFLEKNNISPSLYYINHHKDLLVVSLYNICLMLTENLPIANVNDQVDVTNFFF
jgi:hypothetical protein